MTSLRLTTNKKLLAKNKRTSTLSEPITRNPTSCRLAFRMPPANMFAIHNLPACAEQCAALRTAQKHKFTANTEHNRKHLNARSACNLTHPKTLAFRELGRTQRRASRGLQSCYRIRNFRAPRDGHKSQHAWCWDGDANDGRRHPGKLYTLIWNSRSYNGLKRHYSCLVFYVCRHCVRVIPVSKFRDVFEFVFVFVSGFVFAPCDYSSTLVT